jgi:hypothetical protein
MWVQHVVYPTVVEEEKKIQIHNQKGGDPNRYMSSKDICNRQILLGFPPRAGEVSGPLHLRWPWALETDHDPSMAGGFAFFV